MFRDAYFTLVELLQCLGAIREQLHVDIMIDSNQRSVCLRFDKMLVIDWHFLNRIEYGQVLQSRLQETVQFDQSLLGLSVCCLYEGGGDISKDECDHFD